MTADPLPATAYDVITAVWGSAFIDLFLDFGIPNQASPGNLEALPAGSRYRIFTAAEDIGRLSADRRLDAVRRIVPVDIVAVDLAEADRYAMPGQAFNTHKRMIACHRQAVVEAAPARRAMIFLTPDGVLAEGSIAGLLRMHRAGARAVMTTGIRLSREGFVAALAKRGVATLPPRELVGVALQHLHSWTSWLMADGSETSDNPTAVYWPLRSASGMDGMLVRSFFLHPILVDPVYRARLPGGPIDSHYVRDCCPDVSQVQVVDDSDDLAMFELSPDARLIGNRMRRRGVSVLRLATVASQCNRYHLSHWARPIRLHAGAFDERWADAERSSARLAAKVERYRPVGPALHVMFQTLRMVRRRREAYATRLHKTRRRTSRLVYELREDGAASARQVRKALRPPVTAKQFTRPVKLMLHRVAKAWSVGLKRIRRRVVLFGR